MSPDSEGKKGKQGPKAEHLVIPEEAAEEALERFLGKAPKGEEPEPEEGHDEPSK